MKRINIKIISITIIFALLSWLLIDFLEIVLPKGLGVFYWITDVLIWIIYVFCCIVLKKSKK